MNNLNNETLFKFRDRHPPILNRAIRENNEIAIIKLLDYSPKLCYNNSQLFYWALKYKKNMMKIILEWNWTNDIFFKSHIAPNINIIETCLDDFLISSYKINNRERCIFCLEHGANIFKIN